MNTLKRIVGFVFVAFGTPFMIMAASDLATGADPETGAGVLLGLVAFFGTFTIGGVQLIRASRKQSGSRVAGAFDEPSVLRAVKRFGGTIGAGQLAAHMGVAFSDARDALRSLERDGACRLVVDERGTELFRFPDLALTPEETWRAKDLLED